MLIRNVEIGGETGLDVLIEDGRVQRIGRGLETHGITRIVEGRGGALLPGLHDHHLHLFALAAVRRSVRCGPPEVTDEAALVRALRAAAAARRRPDDWVRGVGYHECVAGDLDADRLEALVPGVPVRIQHRSGAQWTLSRSGLARLDLGPAPPEGVERDADGRPTGRLRRVDDWLRPRLGPSRPPGLAEVGAALARCGVTGLTDATPTNSAGSLGRLARAAAAGALPQRLVVMGPESLPEPGVPRVERGAVKILLHEGALPAFDALAARLAAAHASGRPVAIHCVTRAELVFALAAFEAAGEAPGDRIEHGSIAPPELAARLAARGIAVVAQPNFVRERGDQYLSDVDPVDQPWLVRCRGLLDAGVPLGGGTDAPFGEPDPWLAMGAAIDRRTASGRTLGEKEALSPERALALFTTPAHAPGGTPRAVAPGAAADLCLLDRSWRRARDTLSRELVALTCVGGRIAWQAAR